MNRREFIQSSAGVALGGGFSNHAIARDAVDADVLDRFGGWTGRKFGATGFFRVEKDDRWWLVTPEGNAFLSFGINHLSPDFWRQDYNRDVWKGYKIEIRRGCFYG